MEGEFQYLPLVEVEAISCKMMQQEGGSGLNKKQQQDVRDNFCPHFEYSIELSTQFFNNPKVGGPIKGEQCRDCQHYKYHGLKAYCYYK
jgi:hypothetical protein